MPSAARLLSVLSLQALPRRLALDFRQNVFLMYKEALTNVAKHARASLVEIRLEEQPNLWKLSIQDNGVGFDASHPAGGNGLGNLRSRTERIGGAAVRLHPRGPVGCGNRGGSGLTTPRGDACWPPSESRRGTYERRTTAIKDAT